MPTLTSMRVKKCYKENGFYLRRLRPTARHTIENNNFGLFIIQLSVVKLGALVETRLENEIVTHSVSRRFLTASVSCDDYLPAKATFHAYVDFEDAYHMCC